MEPRLSLFSRLILAILLSLGLQFCFLRQVLKVAQVPSNSKVIRHVEEINMGGRFIREHGSGLHAADGLDATRTTQTKEGRELVPGKAGKSGVAETVVYGFEDGLGFHNREVPLQYPHDLGSAADCAQAAGRRVLVFTMDSTTRYLENAKRGGPAGELVVRKALLKGLGHFGFEVDVASSERDLAQLREGMQGRGKEYDFFFFDQWTYLEKSGRPKSFLFGQEQRLFLLDFFGNPQQQAAVQAKLHTFQSSHFLTAYPPLSTPRSGPHAALTDNGSFLGFFFEERAAREVQERRRLGIIWGKSAKDLEQGKKIMETAAAECLMVSTVNAEEGEKLLQHPSVRFVGTLSVHKWEALLSNASFLLGVGNPLAGPSALDAVVITPTHFLPPFASPGALCSLSLAVPAQTQSLLLLTFPREGPGIDIPEPNIRAAFEGPVWVAASLLGKGSGRAVGVLFPRRR
mmetsp:Transcript_29837/g.70898  ORF Transcript_29837/g.70898 Transcript_29837/m.70898 type:complete len:459 (-) Transcript_29837:341-1717(-)